MQPLRRQARIGGKTVEVHRAHLEPRQHLLDNALHVVEINCRASVQSALLPAALPDRAKCQRRPLFHFLRACR